MGLHIVVREQPRGGMRKLGHWQPRRNQCPTAQKATASERSTSRSEEHTSELQSLMRTSYAVFCLKKKKKKNTKKNHKKEQEKKYKQYNEMIVHHRYTRE